MFLRRVVGVGQLSKLQTLALYNEDDMDPIGNAFSVNGAAKMLLGKDN